MRRQQVSHFSLHLPYDARMRLLLVEDDARIARFVAKRHKRNWGYGLKVVLYQSPDRLGLINLEGTIVAPRPNRPWRPGR